MRGRADHAGGTGREDRNLSVLCEPADKEAGEDREQYVYKDDGTARI